MLLRKKKEGHFEKRKLCLILLYNKTQQEQYKNNISQTELALLGAGAVTAG